MVNSGIPAKRTKLENGDVDEDDSPVRSLKKAQVEQPSKDCPFLATIDRSILDFDFEKLCSVSLSHINIYACLVCGKYFQGRGAGSHAYTHSLDEDHRVFINLTTLKFYCLPDNYEIIDPSLEDIKYVLDPTFTKQQIKDIDDGRKIFRTLNGKSYHPGIVGLNNIKCNDYFNVILHALSHVSPIRNFFLQPENYVNIIKGPSDKMHILGTRFGETIRKLWNPRAFKSHVSPHQLLQAVVICSDKKFQIIKQSDAAEFLSFFLNALHISLNGTQKSSSSIIFRTFRGKMKEYSTRIPGADSSPNSSRVIEDDVKVKEMPFLCLPLELPPAPLYRDELLNNIIPQVPLTNLLQKYNGILEKEYKTYKENFIKRFELIHLPEYLIVTYKRFQKNQFYVEKNPTIINFPISNVDFYDYLSKEAKLTHKYTTYDLLCNIVHDGKPDSGTYRIQLLHKATKKWFELEDMHVKEILAQSITLTESYIQIWKLNRKKTRAERLGEVPSD
uniref:ubiquitinyl hydrolase 1 n=1 Tax=Strongyloides venezuelensis TaxID=75913 RepID=A0A0K0FNZ9_STRVS